MGLLVTFAAAGRRGRSKAPSVFGSNLRSGQRRRIDLIGGGHVMTFDWRLPIGSRSGIRCQSYSNALALGMIDPDHSDVLSHVRKDFDAAGVVQSDEQIRLALNERMLQAGDEMQTAPGGALDAAAVMLARKLSR